MWFWLCFIHCYGGFPFKGFKIKLLDFSSEATIGVSSNDEKLLNKNYKIITREIKNQPNPKTQLESMTIHLRGWVSELEPIDCKQCRRSRFCWKSLVRSSLPCRGRGIEEVGAWRKWTERWQLSNRIHGYPNLEISFWRRWCNRGAENKFNFSKLLEWRNSLRRDLNNE